ncbi:MAG: short-chain dehydrogenase [Chloroflexi bacterium]|nr:MAG: short-chain dehydrogenase [Chloroflexota bacterium]
MAGKKKLQGQVAIVTGGSRGLGLALAEWLVGAGAAVVLAARSEDRVVAEARRLAQAGGRAWGIAADVSDLAQVEEVVDTTLDKFGRIDILVNNAGIVWPIDEVGEVDPDEWAYSIHVNLVGPFYMVHSVLPTMIEQRFGRIVNVSSGLSTTPYAGLSAYSAAKAGLDQFTRILALEVKGAGITVNAVYPGMVDTEMQADLRSVDTSESVIDLSMFHNAAAAGALVSARAAARRLLWLVGPWSRGHTGEIFSFRDQAWLAQVERDMNG